MKRILSLKHNDRIRGTIWVYNDLWKKSLELPDKKIFRISDILMDTIEKIEKIIEGKQK